MLSARDSNRIARLAALILPPPSTRTAHYAWAMLLARIYEVLPPVCPRCGGAMRILAFVSAAATARCVPEHVEGGGGDGDDDQRTRYSDEP